MWGGGIQGKTLDQGGRLVWKGLRVSEKKKQGTAEDPFGKKKSEGDQPKMARKGGLWVRKEEECTTSQRRETRGEWWGEKTKGGCKGTILRENFGEKERSGRLVRRRGGRKKKDVWGKNERRKKTRLLVERGGCMRKKEKKEDVGKKQKCLKECLSGGGGDHDLGSGENCKKLTRLQTRKDTWAWTRGHGINPGRARPKKSRGGGVTKIGKRYYGEQGLKWWTRNQTDSIKGSNR